MSDKLAPVREFIEKLSENFGKLYISNVTIDEQLIPFKVYTQETEKICHKSFCFSGLTMFCLVKFEIYAGCPMYHTKLEISQMR
ncbi:hypothetical protein J437_LFUL008680 [Ladona fulva]|uniref:Uncharacterized protein n=1 Tax=Ladona fulva TaxID=123851 RepID=A0A8K0K5F5_LADFU|nr:hypothetical protein J437_LFUL008680 [Ladona fulva]